MPRVRESSYMYWAKTRSGAKYNLASSGVCDLPLAELPVKIEDLEIGSGDGYGWPPLLEQLAKKLGAPTDSLMAATGTSMANYLAIAAAIEPGDEVLIEHPAYELLVSTALYVGAKVNRFPRHPEDGFRLHPEEVAKAMTPRTRLIVVTNLHNPSSNFTDSETLARIGEIAGEAGARVLVDEVYLEMLFEKMPSSAFHLGPRFVVTGSLTKAYGLSGLRCGWIAADPDFARRCWRLNDLHGATPPHVAERLSAAALANLGPIAARAKKILDTNRPLLNRFLDRAPALDLVRPEFGTVIFPRLTKGSVEDLAPRLRERYETSIVPGRFFEMPGHFRLGIGGTPDIVEEGLKRLEAALAGGLEIRNLPYR